MSLILFSADSLRHRWLKEIHAWIGKTTYYWVFCTPNQSQTLSGLMSAFKLFLRCQSTCISQGDMLEPARACSVPFCSRNASPDRDVFSYFGQTYSCPKARAVGHRPAQIPRARFLCPLRKALWAEPHFLISPHPQTKVHPPCVQSWELHAKNSEPAGHVAGRAWHYTDHALLDEISRKVTGWVKKYACLLSIINCLGINMRVCVLKVN